MKEQTVSSEGRFCQNILTLLLILFLSAGCNGKDPVTLSFVTPDSFTVDMMGGEIQVTVNSSNDVNITTPVWIENKGSVPSAASREYTFAVKTNLTEKDRTGRIVIEGGVKAEVTVLQYGGKVYTPSEDLTGVSVAAKKIVPIGGKTTDERPSAPFRRVWDGNTTGDVYYSEYADGRVADFPVVMDLYFDSTLDFVDHIIYYAPTNGILGAFGRTRISVSRDENASEDEQFEEVAYVDLGMKGGGTVQKIDIPEKVTGVRTVRLSVENGGNGAVGAIQIEFYTIDSSMGGFDPATLFTDATCSELKPGITDDIINECPYPFFKNIAECMLKGTYTREFRIADYKAYQHPEVQARTHKTAQYNLLDNATGIATKGGESLVVMVGDTRGQTISLRIVDWDGEQAGKDGWNTYSSHFLTEGINRIDNVTRGLIYVMYHTDDFKTAQPVRVHFASGTINGYYDSQKHRPEQWDDLLAASTNKHFDVLGKYAHILFPTSNLLTIPNGQEWLDFYEELVYEEQKFMGLEKYDRMFNNRMMFNVMYSNSYMYAAGNHTAYVKSTIPALCDVKKLREDCWGPAHEVGHMNQTRPGLRWLGMTEVTNNIHSMYIQHLNSIQSRLLRQNKYTIAMTDAFSRKPSFAMLTRATPQSGNDVFCQLVPFWQLELYLNEVLGKKDFYKDVYEAVRLDDVDKDLGTESGEIQVDFVYKCCVAAGLDLTDFFERWGFLRKQDYVEISDYGSGRFEVTTEYINKIKADIAALQLPKPAHKFEYITEVSIDAYKDGGKITIGSAHRDGNSFTMSGWKNAVAFEIYNNSNQLIYVSPEPVFTTTETMPTKLTVKAVGVDGSLTSVTL